MDIGRILDRIVEEKADEIKKMGIEAMIPAFLFDSILLDMMEDTRGEKDKPRVYRTWSFLAAQAILWVLEGILKRLPAAEIPRMAYPAELRRDEQAYDVLSPVDVASLSGLVIGEKSPAAKGFDFEKGQVVWDASTEPEYIEYLEVTAIDYKHSEWIQHLYQTMLRNKEWTKQVDADLWNRSQIHLEELLCCFKILERWMDNPADKAKYSPEIPLWRLDNEHLLKPLGEEIGPGRARAVVQALSWNGKTDLAKHPLIALRGKSYMFAYWFCKAGPSLLQHWLYPYFYHGHPTIAGSAGGLRGSIFEEYLKSLIEEITGRPSVKLRESFPGTDIDLIVNLGETGLIVQAKGGVLEMPKSFEKIRWHAITNDDVFQRFEENKVKADDWDATFDCIVRDHSWLKRVGLDSCKLLIPMIVHSKVQPIMIESCREKYGCSDYLTETHSIQTLLERLQILT